MRLIRYTLAILLISTSGIMALTCDEYKAFWVKDGYTAKKIKPLYKECKDREKRENEYWEWKREAQNQISEVYYIPQNTVVCKTRKRFIRVYNTIYNSGSQYTRREVRNMGCIALEGYSVGRIIKRVKNSKVVQIQFSKPFSNTVILERWVHINSITKWTDHQKQFVK